MYNASQHIERCINSIYHQGLNVNEFEVIVINDGSTDNSLEIVKDYFTSYKNIRFFSQKNSGQGAARNLGIKHATGEYILFLDSDDFLLPQSINKILAIVKHVSCDVINFLMEVELPTGNVKESYLYHYDYDKIYSGKELLLRTGINIGSACSSLYKRSFILRNNIFFPVDMKHEDVFFSYQIYTFASRVIFTKTHAYYYCWHPDSTDRKKSYENLKLLQLSDISQAYYLNKLSLDKRVNKELREHLKKISNSTLISLFWSILRNSSVLSKREFKEECRRRGLYPLKGRALSWKTTGILILSRFILAFL
jgi:capsular polysaccharide biosythesis protein cpsI